MSEYMFETTPRGINVELTGKIIVSTSTTSCYTLTLQWLDQDLEANSILFIENILEVDHNTLGPCLSIDISLRGTNVLDYTAVGAAFQISDHSEVPDSITPAFEEEGLLPPPYKHLSLQILAGPFNCCSIDTLLPESAVAFIVDNQ